MTVRDRKARRLPIRPTDAGIARISGLGVKHGSQLDSKSHKPAGLDFLQVVEFVAYDVVEAMRTRSEEGMALCTSDIDRNRTEQ